MPITQTANTRRARRPVAVLAIVAIAAFLIAGELVLVLLLTAVIAAQELRDRIVRYPKRPTGAAAQAVR
jgi:hypothetical protein